MTYERVGKKYTTTIEPKLDEESGKYYAGFRGLNVREKGNALRF